MASKLTGTVALVTGASSGIGADPARRLTDQGATVALVARRKRAEHEVCNPTRSGLNGFTESLRQEPAGRHVRVGGRHVRRGVLEPGAVDTELNSHDSDTIHTEILNPYNEQHERLLPADIADGITCTATRSRHTAVAELRVRPTDQPDHRTSHHHEGVPDEARIAERTGRLAHRSGCHDHGRHLHHWRRAR
ncbi:SDR family NAD(P)-dependent oxidoreductase [Streptomyces clavifer]|uniref:SDR family NAD(P)-dependent oxidoreductase n=1 Tax=Streptomyces clavifer TaxID=68188 RepID=UPI0033F7C167